MNKTRPIRGAKVAPKTSRKDKKKRSTRVAAVVAPVVAPVVDVPERSRSKDRWPRRNDSRSRSKGEQPDLEAGLAGLLTEEEVIKASNSRHSGFDLDGSDTESMTSETSDIASGCWSILAVGVYAACLNYRIVWSIYGINAWTLFYNILLSCYEFWGSEFAYIYVFISLGSFICSALTGVTLLQDFRYRAAGRLIKMNLCASFILFCAFFAINNSELRNTLVVFSHNSFLFSSLLTVMTALIVFVNVEAFNEASRHFSSATPDVDLATKLADSSGKMRWPFRFKGRIVGTHLMLVARSFKVEEGMVFWGYETLNMVVT